MASPRMSSRPTVCLRFVSGADLGNPLGNLFHIAHKHAVWGSDVPFGVQFGGGGGVEV